MRNVLLFWLLLAFFFQAKAEVPISIKNGFLTGNDFMALSSEKKQAYMTGFVDSLFVSPFLSAPKASVQPYESCLTGMNQLQLVKIVEKHLNERPEILHQPMNTSAFFAIKSACGLMK